MDSEGFAYFRWRSLIRAKYGPLYFDTEFGAQITWTIRQGNYQLAQELKQ